jgi:hypothetical protein
MFHIRTFHRDHKPMTRKIDTSTLTVKPEPGARAAFNAGQPPRIRNSSGSAKNGKYWDSRNAKGGTIACLDTSTFVIGELFRKVNATAIDSVRLWIECGALLKAKRASLKHGEWLPWLEANIEILGFGELKAQRMMKAAQAYPSLAKDLEPAEALRISRQIWGHTSKLAPRISLKPAAPQDDPSIVAIVPAENKALRERVAIMEGEST